MPLVLASPAFVSGETIPVKYSRDGANVSPSLRWTGVPNGARSLVLIMEDPDAPGGTFRHWAVFNIPPDRDHLPEGVQARGEWASLREGRNDFDNSRYDGPEPPRGHGAHRYHFRLAALDTPILTVPPNATIEQVWREARKHMLEQAEMVGVYQR
jgi:Raf kinase inhibitor-like YbhB/YbcL family protein